MASPPKNFTPAKYGFVPGIPKKKEVMAVLFRDFGTANWRIVYCSKWNYQNETIIFSEYPTVIGVGGDLWTPATVYITGLDWDGKEIEEGATEYVEGFCRKIIEDVQIWKRNPF